MGPPTQISDTFYLCIIPLPFALAIPGDPLILPSHPAPLLQNLDYYKQFRYTN